MNKELLLLTEKHTDRLIEQTKNSQETHEFKLNTQMETFSFNRPTNLCEEGKWLLAVTSSEAANSVFNIIDENNGFSITTPGHWTPKNREETLNKLNN